MIDTNIRIDVIATYDNIINKKKCSHFDQDWFECGISQKALKSEKTLINYIKKQLRNKKNLVKISLCFIWSLTSFLKLSLNIDIILIYLSLQIGLKYFLHH